MARLVQSEPSKVSHLAQALQYFLTEELVERDSPSLPHLLTWARCSPLRALSLLCKRTLPSHPITAQYATRVLNSYPAEVVIFYIPQLVQAVRYDDLGYVQEFIRNISERSNLVAHQLMWNLETNMYVDEEGGGAGPLSCTTSCSLSGGTLRVSSTDDLPLPTLGQPQLPHQPRCLVPIPTRPLG